jgi:hypothetical protein
MKRYPAQIWNRSNGGNRYKTGLSREHESAAVENEYAGTPGKTFSLINLLDFQKKPGTGYQTDFQFRSLERANRFDRRNQIIVHDTGAFPCSRVRQNAGFSMVSPHSGECGYGSIAVDHLVRGFCFGCRFRRRDIPPHTMRPSLFAGGDVLQPG